MKTVKRDGKVFLKFKKKHEASESKHEEKEENVKKGEEMEHDEHPELSKKTAKQLAKDHVKKDTRYYDKEDKKC